MSKKDKQIMVVKKNVLLKNYFEGFRQIDETNYEELILNNFEYMTRGIAEEDSNFKQPIGYAIIINPKLKKVFAYQRSSKDENYKEKRLQGKYSWGVGGHIEKQDNLNGNPIHSSMLRELAEEVGLNGKNKLKVIGYINNDADMVGKVHFGILYLIETDATEINPKDKEMENGSLKTIEELEKICSIYQVESWSKIALEILKEHMQ